MSTLGSYPTRTFKESQKFLVLDPETQSASLVLGRDLVEYITPRQNYVFSEQSRAVAQNEDYQLGALIQTAGDLTAGDNFAGTFLVVPGGDGDFPMANGNDLLIIKGDILLREQLASNTPTHGSDLVAHTGTTDTVTEALDKRTIYVGSVAELEAINPIAHGQIAYLAGRTTEGDGGEGEFRWDASDLSAEVAVDSLQGIYVAPASAPSGTSGAWIRVYQDTVSIAWFGAIGDAATNASASINAAAEMAGEGNKVYIPEGVFLVTDTLVSLVGQTWEFVGEILFTDGGVDLSGGVFSLRSGVTLINPRFDEDFQNNISTGQGTKYTISAYNSKNWKIFGGVLKNARHNFIQFGAGTTGGRCFGTIFDTAGEHCIYSSEIVAPGDSGNATNRDTRFIGCRFLSPGMTPNTNDEGHFVKHRGGTDIHYIGCFFGGEESSRPRFILASENSSNIRFTDCTAVAVNHNAISLDQNSSDVYWSGGVIDKRVSNGLSSAFVACSNPNGVVVISDCTVYSAVVHPNALGVTIRDSTIYLPSASRLVVSGDVSLTRVNLICDATTTVGDPIRVKGGRLGIKDSSFFLSGATGITIGMLVSDSGAVDINGLKMPDWDYLVPVVRLTPTSADMQKVKGLELPDDQTYTALIQSQLTAGDVVIGECTIRSGGIKVDAGANLVSYGNIFA